MKYKTKEPPLAHYRKKNRVAVVLFYCQMGSIRWTYEPKERADIVSARGRIGVERSGMIYNSSRSRWSGLKGWKVAAHSPNPSA